ncbi:MAG: ATP-binding protein [Prosthecobacter sp.]
MTDQPPATPSPDGRVRTARLERLEVERQGMEARAQAVKSKESLLATWQRMVETRDGVFADRDTRRAALNLLEDAEHARRAEQRASQERQRAEGEVLASETKYRRLFESIDEGFCIIEVLFRAGIACDYRFLEANPAFAKQTGLVNVIGRTLRDLGAVQDARVIESFGKIALTGEPHRFEQSIDATGGVYDVYAFRVEEPEKHHVAVLFNDITERKRREVNLAFLADIAADLSRLSSADEIMQAVGARTGGFLKISSCNFVNVDEARDELKLVHGWTVNAATDVRHPLRIADYLGEEFRPACRAGDTIVVRDTAADPRTDAAAYAGLEISAFVIVPFHRDGEWRHFLAITDAQPRDWRADEVEVFQEVASRVFPRLERARVEEALRESEERQRIALDAAAMAAWDYDVVSDRAMWNDQHYHLLGLQPDGQGKKAADFLAMVHPDDRGAVEDGFRLGIEESGTFQAEFRIVRQDGVVRWMSGFGKAIASKSGHAARMGGVMFDVTERHEAGEALAAALRQTRAAQAEAEAANRAKDRFLAVLSHELRTPLTPALMATHMLLEDNQLSEDTRDILEMIQRNIALEGKLVDDLLDITRITRGTLKLDMASADLHQVIRHAHEICLPELKEKRQIVALSLDAAEHGLHGDGARLQQVVWNLLKNACKFSANGSRIDLRTRNEGGHLLMQVTDTGIGLEPEALTRIFDAFTQANDGIMRRFGGLGLGLAISKAIVETHGGHIWAESAGPGQGTTFHVSLPLSVKA